MHRSKSQRYAAWIDARRHLVLLLAVLTALGAGAIASTLPVHADFSYLLPERSLSVQHLRVLEKRARVLGTAMVAVRCQDPEHRTAMVAVRCQDPEHRAQAAARLRDGIAALGADEVSHITFDRHVGRQWAWQNRWYLPSVQQLTELRDGIEPYLRGLKRRANPMALGLDDDAADDDTDRGPAEAGAEAAAPTPGGSRPEHAIEALGAQLRQLERDASEPGPLVSKDGRLQMMVVQTPFNAGDTARDRRLLGHIEALRDEVRATWPDVEVGVAGDVVTSFEEHGAILEGMAAAVMSTVALCLLALWAFYGTLQGVLALAGSLAVGTLLTFMVTRLTVGHLNLATAFLASIVLGNGINFGIMLLARLLEALREGRRGAEAMGDAIAATVHGTLAAAVTAAVAYFSLMCTAFRGFWHFGVIAGSGMLLCWACAYTVLPAALLVLMRRGRVQSRGEPAIGRWLSHLLPRRLGPVVLAAAILAVGAGRVTYRFLADDPYEANFKNLRSESPALIEERAWMAAVDEAFGKGISGGFVIGAPSRAEVPQLLRRLRAIDEGRPEAARLFSRINALDDMVPQDQAAKRPLLQEIRARLAPEAIARMGLPAAAKRRLEALRPPAALPEVGDGDVPEALAWPFIETDGSRGKLLLAMSGWGFEIWNSHDIVRFADTVRGLDLGPDVLLGGSAFVFSDMLRLIERDGPRATVAATAAATVVVLAVLGLCAEAFVTLICGAMGTLLMLAVVAVSGLRVNFLDFVALPITIGIGIDYAVNICARARVEPRGTMRGRRALITAGGAVCMASYTTIVGYGSLLLSTNLGIRSFGHAAILGELTCLAAALVLAPALLDLGRRSTTVEPARPPAGQGPLSS